MIPTILTLWKVYVWHANQSLSIIISLSLSLSSYLVANRFILWCSAAASRAITLIGIMLHCADVFFDAVMELRKGHMKKNPFLQENRRFAVILVSNILSSL